MPTNRQNVRTMQKTGIAESNDNLRILTETSEITVPVHAQYKFD